MTMRYNVGDKAIWKINGCSVEITLRQSFITTVGGKPKKPYYKVRRLSDGHETTLYDWELK